MSPTHLIQAASPGRIDHPAFGQNVPVKRGTLELFFPSDNPTFKLITYGLTFEHEGQDYHLPGRKEVRNDPDFDLWSDTSTLYVLLHKNSDAARPVIGAGILKLAPGELTNMARGIRSPGAHSLADEWAVVTKFGRYFLGEIHDQYAAWKNPWWRFWR